MKKSFKTAEAEMILNNMMSLAKREKGKLGFALARNVRVFKTELTEYIEKKNELIQKYGEEVDGSIAVKIGTPAHKAFLEEILEYANIDIEIDVMTVSMDDVINSELTGEEMYLLDSFMIID